jgi:hypothetical protein
VGVITQARHRRELQTHGISLRTNGLRTCTRWRMDTLDNAAEQNEFVRLHAACRKELEAFYEDSRQLLNVIALAELFPKDARKQSALDYHFRTEIEAKNGYDRRRRDLFDFVVVRSLEKKASSKAR